MTRHAAFVRNVMIGREGLHRSVLLDIVERAGGLAPRSYIATGNVTFDADPADVAMIVHQVEEAIAGVVGRREEVFVRTLEHLASVDERDPFAFAPFPDPQHRLISFAKTRVEWPGDVARQSDRGDWCIAAIEDRDVFAVTRLVDGTTRDPGGLIQRITGQRMTSRSWTTVGRILRDPA
jgi:uncharacterized protein (DUF1697 family)